MQMRDIAVKRLSIHESKERWIREGHVVNLVNSIKTEGVMTPLVVAESDGTYKVLAGAHRLLAAVRLSMKTVPCVILDTQQQDLEVFVLQLEGLQRPVNPIQEGQVLRKLLELGYSQEELARMIGKSSSWVQHRLALVTQLVPQLQELVGCGSLSSKKAQDIARMPARVQEQFAMAVIREKLSAKEVARLVALYNRSNTDETTKEYILNTPKLACQLGSDRSLRKKNLNPQVRSVCYQLDEMTNRLMDFKAVMKEGEEFNDAERKQLRTKIEALSSIIGELQAAIGIQRKSSSKEVSGDSSGDRRSDGARTAGCTLETVSGHHIPVSEELQGQTTGGAEEETTIGLGPKQGYESGTNQPVVGG